jgi:predicted DNA-binding transcriptional regulator AlpA
MNGEIETQRHELFQALIKKYGRTVISKSEMAQELGVSNSTLDLYIAKGTGLPNYKKLGKAKNAKVVFNLVDVADYLTKTIKTF